MNNRILKNLRLPTHIAFILDGNGRWAKKRGLPRTIGHKVGINAVKNTINACLEFGIPFVSMFAFSTENFNREKSEVDEIFRLLHEFLQSDFKETVDKGIKIITSGDLSRLPQNLQEAITNIKEATKNNNKIVLNLCLNYGGRDEIIRAINLICLDKKDKIDTELFKSYLYTASIPDPDFVIRTSGELRLSNFMMFQCAYSELYFPKVFWPDFNRKHLLKALKEYSKRNRRFGKII